MNSLKVVYNHFKLPNSIKVVNSSSTSARFLLEPFEKGFGHTLGNSLRRIMLTAIEAPSIVSVRIEDVVQEYMSIEGIVEDMPFIILNLKKVKFRNLHARDLEKKNVEKCTIESVLKVTEEELKKCGGQKAIKAGKLFVSENFEVTNPDFVICNVTKPMKKNFVIEVRVGRGYIPAERYQIDKRDKERIYIDSIFSPVVKVNYIVENTRVGQDTDFDRLIIDVETDGRVSPQDALIFASNILKEHLAVFDKNFEVSLVFEEESKSEDKAKDALLDKLALQINEIELSVRSANCLKNASIGTIGELVTKCVNDMLQYKNFGKKSLVEIEEKLSNMGLKLGMDLSQYNINADNILDVIKVHKESKLKKKTSLTIK